jgi:hypothetical protein
LYIKVKKLLSKQGLTHIAHNPTIGIDRFWIHPFAGLIFIMMIHGDKTFGRLRTKLSKRKIIEELRVIVLCLEPRDMHAGDDEA